MISTFRRFIASVLTGAFLFGPAAAEAEELRLGLIAPDDGAYALLGDQVRVALEAFAQTAELEVTVVEAPETCEDGDGEDAAVSMVEAGVDAVIGLFCVETLLSAMPVLTQSAIPAFTLSVRADIMIEDALSRDWPLFRLAPSADAEAQKVAEIIAADWASEPFALIEDGTIYGRDLVETVRLEISERGITPSFVDNFRPAQELQFGLVRRLANAGVTHVFVGGDRSDLAIIARDAAAAGLGLTFMGGDSLFAADLDVELPGGVFAVLADRPDVSKTGEAVAAIEAAGEAAGFSDMAAADGYALSAYAAAEIVAAVKAGTAAGSLRQALRTGRFDTVLGPIRFGADQTRDGERFSLYVWSNGAFRPVESARPAPAR